MKLGKESLLEAMRLANSLNATKTEKEVYEHSDFPNSVGASLEKEEYSDEDEIYEHSDFPNSVGAQMEQESVEDDEFSDEDDFFEDEEVDLQVESADEEIDTEDDGLTETETEEETETDIETDSQEELSEEQEKVIEAAVSRVLAAYMKLKNVYWNKSIKNIGVLTPDGVLTLNRDSRQLEYVSEADTGIANSLYTKITQASNLVGSLKFNSGINVNLFAFEHIAKLLERYYSDSGVATLAINEESYFIKVKQDLTREVSEIVRNCGNCTEDSAQVIEKMFTNAIIVASFNNFKKIELVVITDNKINKGELINGIGSADSFKRNSLIVTSDIEFGEHGVCRIGININDKLEDFVSKQYGELVKNVVNKIEKVYTGLFASGYGVIEPDGLICDSSEGGVYMHLENMNGHSIAKRENNIIMEDITELFMSQMGIKQHNGRKITLKAIFDGYNYFPMKLLEVAFGRCASSETDIKNEVYKRHARANIWKNGKTGYWDTAVEEPIKNECLETIKELLRLRQKNGLDITDKEQKREFGNEVKELLNKLYLAYTPCIILSENSEGRLKIRISDVENKINPNNILPTLLDIVGSKENSDNNTSFVQRLDGVIKEFEIIKEAKLCGASPLFAYTALNKLKERGEAPSWDNLILGRAEDDSIYIGNNPENGNKFVSVGNTVIHISAGSRSGKGVQTLNILASAYASLIPVFYLDGKPDMSALLNYIANKYGVPTFAVNAALYDPKADKGGVMKRILDNKVWRIPECASSNERFSEKQMWGALEYVKALNFCVWLMVQVSQGKIEGYDNIVVVADELWKVIGKWKEFINKWKQLRTTQKDIEAGKASELAIYANLVTDWYHNSISSWIGASQSSTNNILPTLFAIYQEHQETTHTAWKPEKLEDGANPANSFLFKGLTSIGNAGLIGYDAKDTQPIASTPKGKKYLTQANRYFAFVNNMDTQDANTADFFKPFLILNDVENENSESSYIGEMKKQIKSSGLEPERVLKEHRTDGTHLDSGIGFEGYISSMGGDIKNALSASYKIADDVLRRMGYYKSSGACTPFEFFTDFRADYMLSWEQMNKALETGVIGNKGSGDMGELDKEKDPFEEYMQYQEEELAKQNKTSGAVEQFNSNNPSRETDMYTRKAMEYQNQYGASNLNSLSQPIIEEEYEEEEEFINYGGQEQPIDDSNTEDELLTRKVDTTPEITKYDTSEAVGYSGTNFRRNIIKPQSGCEVLKCNSANSIIVEMPESSTAERYASKLFETFGGTRYEFDRRWKLVLDSIGNDMNKNLVTRVSLMENTMYVNKTLAHLNGVIGGLEDIRLSDIVDFGKLFKKFKNIEELVMDEVIFEVAVNYYKNPFISLFEMSSRLKAVIVLQGMGKQPLVFTKSDLDSGDKEKLGGAGQLMREARFRSSMDFVSNEIGSKKGSESPGEKARLNQIALNMSKRAGGKFKENLKRKDTGVLKKSSTLLGYGMGTLGLMAVGGILSLIGRNRKKK